MLQIISEEHNAVLWHWMQKTKNVLCYFINAYINYRWITTNIAEIHCTTRKALRRKYLFAWMLRQWKPPPPPPHPPPLPNIYIKRIRRKQRELKEASADWKKKRKNSWINVYIYTQHSWRLRSSIIQQSAFLCTWTLSVALTGWDHPFNLSYCQSQKHGAFNNLFMDSWSKSKLNKWIRH